MSTCHDTPHTTSLQSTFALSILVKLQYLDYTCVYMIHFACATHLDWQATTQRSVTDVHQAYVPFLPGFFCHKYLTVCQLCSFIRLLQISNISSTRCKADVSGENPNRTSFHNLSFQNGHGFDEHLIFSDIHRVMTTWEYHDLPNMSTSRYI